MQLMHHKTNLFSQLNSGACVITPNNRLSATLLEDYFDYYTDNLPNQCVDKPLCLPYRTLLITNYQRLLLHSPKNSHPSLLTDMQTQALWRACLQNHPDITYNEGLLKAIMDAWNNCLLWNINPDDNCFQYTPQTLQFQQWWQIIHQKLLELHAITESELSNYFIEKKQTFNAPTLIWACFDDFTPQQKSLQEYLLSEGVPQYCYELEPKNAKTYQITAKDTKAEREQLLLWLQERLHLGDKRIGVIVPDLQQQAEPLYRYMKQHVDNELFNISLGKSLKEFPLVAHAMHWIHLDKEPISTHQIKLLLSSPYLISANEEFIKRAEYMQESLMMEEEYVEFKSFVKDLYECAPLLAETLKNLTPYPLKASPVEWVTLFKGRLEHMGFPGNDGLLSDNYQCFCRFTELFDDLRQMEDLYDTLTLKEALSILNQLVGNTVFQAQTKAKPIQILGLLEASGCAFDSLWVLGLTDESLPEKTRLSPFIPHGLQREKNMPHSTPIRQLQFAQQFIERLKKSAPVLVVSYPQLSGDSPNLPCPLTQDFEPYSIETKPKTANTSLLIPIEESYLLPLKLGEKITGGTALLANQAKCPFRAFAAHRLKAKVNPEITEGIDAKTRGQLIHRVMELLWRDLGSQKTLLTLPAIELENKIDVHIQEALAKPQKSKTAPLFIQQIEHTRLKELVNAAFEWEKKRPPFTVEALEQAYSIELNGLTIRIRLDRLDKLENGQLWVIDYKTTLPTNKPWQEVRPTEPQLLLYALLEEAIDTLLFIELKAGQLKSLGLSEEENPLLGIGSPKKGQSFEEYKTLWKTQLEALAKEFQEGHCPPTPINSTVCTQCDFQNLCQI